MCIYIYIYVSSAYIWARAVLAEFQKAEGNSEAVAFLESMEAGA